MKAFGHRELYAPAHFGNSYEEMGMAEAVEILSEARWWGFNAYGDWFDNADMLSPARQRQGGYTLSRVLADKKLDWFAVAAKCGLELDLIITPNQVFMDQVSSAPEAEKGDERYYGQLLCPSRPEARRIILDNHRLLFDELRSRGVGLASISACPFDPGGCSCQQCAPWIVTFGRLTREILALARERFPEVRARLIGWWWTAEEHQAFKAWADREAPGAFVSLAMHLKYGQTEPDAGRLLPDRCEPQVFVHIGYSDSAKVGQARGRDVYGSWGPVVAPVRIPATLEAMARAGMVGFAAYSEGSFDDLNKALLAGLSSGRFRTAQEILAAYAERYFGAAGAEAGRWASWIANWGMPFDVDLAAARREFELLARGARRSWRLEQLEGRLRLFEANAAVEKLKGWGPQRLAAAEKYFAEQERIYREVWKVGLVRGGLHPKCFELPWTDQWREVVGKASGRTAFLNEA